MRQQSKPLGTNSRNAQTFGAASSSKGGNLRGTGGATGNTGKKDRRANQEPIYSDAAAGHYVGSATTTPSSQQSQSNRGTPGFIPGAINGPANSSSPADGTRSTPTSAKANGPKNTASDRAHGINLDSMSGTPGLREIPLKPTSGR
ncbi:hypothetical protein GGF37_007293, partial [Kickxella alabastrina]